MKRDELAEDARVIAAATAGPWYFSRSSLSDTVWHDLPSGGMGRVTVLPISMTAEPDGLFITRARARYPELVREVRELRAINDAQYEALLEFERVLRTDAACVAGWDQFQRAITLMGKALYHVRPQEAL